MSHVALGPGKLLLEPRQSRRDRWASLLAAAVCTAHVAAATIVFGWYFWIVQQWKSEFNDFGCEITAQATSLIRVSDRVFDYWYLLVPIAPITLFTDFVATRWIARRIGLRYASLGGLFVIVLMLANVAVGQYILIDAKAEILKLVSIQDSSPPVTLGSTVGSMMCGRVR